MSLSKLKTVQFLGRLSQCAGRRCYGTTTSGKASEHVLTPRGLIPGPPTNYWLFGGAVASLVLAYGFREYGHNLRTQKKFEIYREQTENGMEWFRDFDNKRMPKYAKVLADGPCGDTFKEAYLCAVFSEEGTNCAGKFEEFVGCVQKQPEMQREVKPDGKWNWNSKLFLTNLKTNKQYFDNLLASVGPAEEDMEEVLDNYRARHILGESASEKEVDVFKKKFHDLRDSFWSEVDALLDGSKSDGGQADKLMKQLMKDYSVPADVWLQILKDYDVEEFDDMLTLHRRKYGMLSHRLIRYKLIDEVSNVDLSGVTCGDNFAKWYKCLKDKRDTAPCADFIDELYFCKQHNNKEVWPRVKALKTKDPSYFNEIERVQEVLTYDPLIH